MKHKCWVCGGEAVKGFEIYNRRAIGKEREQYGGADADVPLWLLKVAVSPTDGQRVYCAECFDKTVAEKQELSNMLAILNVKNMLEKAIRMLERQGSDVYDYRDAIERVKEYAFKSPEKFASSHEALAAIILISKGYKIKMQYPVENFRVDFYLPKLKVLLEIDGYIHKSRKKQDAERDAKILAAMPSGWQIIRIPTEHIERKADLLITAINAVLEERAKVKRLEGRL